MIGSVAIPDKLDAVVEPEHRQQRQWWRNCVRRLALVGAAGVAVIGGIFILLPEIVRGPLAGTVWDQYHPPTLPNREAEVIQINDALMYERRYLKELGSTVHIAYIDQRHFRDNLMIQPPDPESELIYSGVLTSKVAQDLNWMVAFNGSFFAPFEGRLFSKTYPGLGDPVRPYGQVIIDGEQIHPPEEGFSVLCLGPDGVTVVPLVCPEDTWQGVPGRHILVWEGQVVVPVEDGRAHPRMLLGITKDGSIVKVMVEGRRLGRPGMTLTKAAEWMVEELGAEYVLEFDGGGSAIMVIRYRGADGEIKTITARPSTRIAAVGWERRVGVPYGLTMPPSSGDIAGWGDEE
jgi:hypothetical protein